jgi:hypothetical protein
MTPPKNSPNGIPTSSGKNRRATQRTMVIAAIVAVLVFAAMWVPW